MKHKLNLKNSNAMGHKLEHTLNLCHANVEIESYGRDCIVKIDGQLVVGLTNVKIEYKPLDYATVTFSFDADVKTEGILCSETITELKCEKCGARLGHAIGQYAIACPNCGEKMVSPGGAI